MIAKLFGLIWAIVRTIYRIAATLLLLAVIASVWFAFEGGAPLRVQDNVALVVSPTGEVVDQSDRDASERFFENLSGQPPSHSSLRSMVLALEEAKDDNRIKLVVLKLDDMVYAGLAQLDELHKAVQDVRAAGKQVIAWSPAYDQMQYYAAAAADDIVLDPMGTVMVDGLSVYKNYYADALAKLGVDIHVFRVGEYKSAVEPFIRNDMSEDAKAANRVWLGDLWGTYGAEVASARDLKPSTIDNYVSGFHDGLIDQNGDAAAYAKQAGLVTHLETLQQFRTRMAKEVGFDDDIGSFRQINYLDYLSARSAEGFAHHNASEKKVALVVVEGEIVDGYADTGKAGGDDIANMLDDARRDDDVAAVVLRVNSPGGSVFASEKIRRAVQQLRDDGKPVVASMSSVAASGGYWVSMDANQIWAHDTTITGSIGVFGMIPTIDRALAKIGVHTDGVGTTPLAGALRLDRPITGEVGEIVQASVDKIYRDFIGNVAKARKMTVDQVDQIARGRVWSGSRALELGLVDEIGGLDQAADAAAKLAGLSPGKYQLDERMPSRSFAEQLMLHFGESSQIAVRFMPKGVLSWLQQGLHQTDAGNLLSTFNDPQGIYANCMCDPRPPRLP